MRRVSRLRFQACLGSLDALQEHLHDAIVELLAEHAILVARLDARVVVDLDHQRLVADLLHIDAIQAVADQVRRAQRRPQHGLRHQVHRDAVHLAGIDVSQMRDDEQAKVRNQRIGFVFQQFNLLPRTTAEKQVALPLMYGGYGRSERLERAKEALTAVGLGQRIDHKPDELSGGQQQRVAIARALATTPSIILADEPTGALDTQSGEEILNIFKDLHAKGMTIVMITHDPEVAEHAQRTIWIRDGVIVEHL
ncbi:MAG: ABC transporter ATP-binding protein [Anaerolineae bacterium]|nr:ABC transporter ATP-binding protein [Anaerolineae bacterium]